MGSSGRRGDLRLLSSDRDGKPGFVRQRGGTLGKSAIATIWDSGRDTSFQERACR
jgi:hypothetical protein